MQFTFINIFAMIIDSIIVIPEMLHAVKGVNKRYQGSKVIAVLDYILKYGCLILMFVPLGLEKFYFSSVPAMLIYVLGNAVLAIIYMIIYVINIKKDSYKTDTLLTHISCVIFMLSGLVLKHYFLISCTIFYEIIHQKVIESNKIYYKSK